MKGRGKVEHGIQADNNPDLFDETEHGKTSEDLAQRQAYEDDANKFANQYYDTNANNKNGLTLEQATDAVKAMMPEPKTQAETMDQEQTMDDGPE